MELRLQAKNLPSDEEFSNLIIHLTTPNGLSPKCSQTIFQNNNATALTSTLSAEFTT